MQAILFYITAIVAILSALFVIKCRNPVNSALNLVTVFICLAVYYVMLESPFMAAIQILVYAGAIVVLIIFVLMLLNLGMAVKKGYTHAVAGSGCVSALLLLVAYNFLGKGQATGTGGEVTSKMIAEVGHTEMIGRTLFVDFLLPFEIASILLLVAIVGAVVISKRNV
jgi:NADH-quinone oxidoreductase subunit J